MLNKMFLKAFFIQSLWNYERLQNIGFLFVIKPFLDKIYSDKEKRKEALLRHTGFFNTHPYMANVIVAISANVEKRNALKGSDERHDVNLLKSSMAGPLAALGDSFFWGTLRPAASFICIYLVIVYASIFVEPANHYPVFIPLLFLCIYNVIHIPFRYWIMFISFKFDRESIMMLSKFEFGVLGDFVRYVCIVIVLVSIFFYFKAFAFNPPGANFFGALPDCAVFGGLMILFTILGRISAVFMFYSVILLCIVAAYMGM